MDLFMRIRGTRLCTIGLVAFATVAALCTPTALAYADDSSTAAPTATATPAPTPTPSPSAAPGSSSDSSGTTDGSTGNEGDSASSPGGEDPSLAVMNAAHNHSMGSTVATEDPESAAPLARSFSVQSLAAQVGQPAGVPGLDVSGWQTLTRGDWTTIYNNGARFVYVKATEGTDYKSGEFNEQYTDSYSAGLAHGAYHFATPNTSSGAAQANYFVSNGGGWSADGRTLPPLLDIEYNPYGATCYGLSQSAMVSWIKDFSDTVLARVGRLPAIYSTTDWWTRCTGNSPSFPDNPLFIARYTTSGSVGTLPASWSAYTFWQWADGGTFPGDQDVFNGTLAQLTTFARTGLAHLPNPVIGVGDFNGDGKSDLVARKPDGSLWFFAGLGAGGTFAPGVQIGAGWNTFDEILGPGDMNGDGKPDILARKPDGSLWIYAGTGTGGVVSGVQIGAGWNTYTDVIAAGDLNGDGVPDLLGRKPDGRLFYYAGTGTSGVSGSSGVRGGTQVGAGWQTYEDVEGVGDLNGDGKDDLIARRPDGTLIYYAGLGTTAAGVSGLVNGATVSHAFGGYTTLIAAGDVTGDKRADLLALTPDGTMWVMYGTSDAARPIGAVKSGVKSGGGWQSMTAILEADMNGDGKTDVITRHADSTLWVCRGTGTTASGNAGLRAAVQIGAGWNSFTALMTADFNGDGKDDIIARKQDSTLWLYAGTGDNGVRSGVQIGAGWNSFTAFMTTDFNGDGNDDIIVRKPDGTLWLYPGNGKGGFQRSTQIGAGWDVFDSLMTADLNRDGKPDIIARKPDGSLWFYAGTGTGGVLRGIQIGAGWNVYNTLVAGDLNGDGKADILGRKADGSLWFYSQASPTANLGLTGQVFASSGWNIYG